MKTTLTKIDLASALSTVSAAIPSRPTHPVLANVRLIADKDLQTITLIGFDLTLGIKTSFNSIIDESGEVCIPFKLLIDIVSKLEGSLSLECEEGETLTTLTSITGNYELRGMSTEEYPELPKFEGDEPKRVELSVESIKAGLNGTLYAVSGDVTKQILTGVNINSNEASLAFAATDGHRLAVVTLDEDLDESLSLTIPSFVLTQVKSAITKLDGDDLISVFVNDSQIEFLIGDTEIKSRLLEGSYPNYPSLIPTSAPKSVVIERRALMAALERIAIIADRKNNIVKFNFQTNKLRLEVDSADVGSGKEALPTQSQGDDILIAFNVKYILETLRNIGTTEIVFEMNEPGSPLLIKPLGGVNATHLIMPVTIRD